MMRYFLIFFFFMMADIASAQSYSIPGISVRAEIQEDGTILIEEARTYIFEGSFSWADYRLPRRGFSEIGNIRVSEEGHRYLNENNEEPGTFSVSESDRRVEIKWHYQAEDETRTFLISYELKGAIVSGPEHSEFFWNFIASGREKATEQFSASVILPEEVESGELHFWDYSSGGVHVQAQNNGYHIQGNELSRRQTAEIRMVFPAEVFSGPAHTIFDPEYNLADVTAHEQQRIAEQEKRAERQRFFEEFAKPATGLLLALSISVFVFCYQRYGKRYSTSHIYTKDTIVVPDNLPPAIAGRLVMGGFTNVSHFLATLFDLARRGWFQLAEAEKKGSVFSTTKTELKIIPADQKPNDNLQNWEEKIIHHLEEDFAGKEPFVSDVLKSYSFYHKWSAQVSKYYKNLGWTDKNSYKGALLNGIFQLIILSTALVFVFFSESLVAIAALVVAFCLLLASLFIIRYSAEGQEQYERWKAYWNGLKKTDEQMLRLGRADKHFIYSVAFQLNNKKIEENLELVSAEAGSDIAFLIPWIILLSGSNRSPADVAASITTLVASSGSSFGGSISGGGGVGGVAGGGASGGAG